MYGLAMGGMTREQADSRNAVKNALMKRGEKRVDARRWAKWRSVLKRAMLAGTAHNLWPNSAWQKAAARKKKKTGVMQKAADGISLPDSVTRTKK